MEKVIYFELNNWTSGKYYPDDNPFDEWVEDDLFLDENWVKENKLCVVNSIIDMSFNFCITATEKWVKENCPKLLTDYREFLRYPDEDGYVYGRFGDEFLEYGDENIGITFAPDN